MQTISIRIDDDVAQLYQDSTTQGQEKLQLLFNFWLRNIARISERSLDEIMDEISDRAQARGLTSEILDSLLKDE